MINFVLLITVVLAAASFVSDAAHSENWAITACSLAPLACQNPQATAYGAVALGGLWIVMKLVAVLR